MNTDCASCGEPVRDQAMICWRETRRLTARLVEAATLWDDGTTCRKGHRELGGSDVDIAIAKAVRMGDPVPRAGRPAPAQAARWDANSTDQVAGLPSGLPFDWRASESAWTVRNVVGTWARVMAQTAGADLPAGMGALMRWLADRLVWARHQQWAPEAWDELDDAVALCWRLVDRPAARTRFPVGPCPEVGEVGLCAGTVWASVPAVESRPALMACDGCGVAWSTDQWARAGRRILARMMRETA